MNILFLAEGGILWIFSYLKIQLKAPCQSDPIRMRNFLDIHNPVEQKFVTLEEMCFFLPLPEGLEHSSLLLTLSKNIVKNIALQDYPPPYSSPYLL